MTEIAGPNGLNPGVREELRRQSQPWHKKLDQHPVLLPLTQGLIGLEDYNCALTLMQKQWTLYALHANWAIPFVRALDHDLGGSCWQLDSADEAIEWRDPLDELAWTYVMWGSLMGSRFLARSIPNLARLPSRFFATAAHSRPDISWPTKEQQTADLDELGHRAVGVFKHWLTAADQIQSKRLPCAS